MHRHLLKAEALGGEQAVCPAMITPSSSTTIGWRKPNSFRLAATLATAASGACRGLRAYGVGCSTGHHSTVSLSVAVVFIATSSV